MLGRLDPKKIFGAKPTPAEIRKLQPLRWEFCRQLLIMYLQLDPD
jgi:hypothetical protein